MSWCLLNFKKFEIEIRIIRIISDVEVEVIIIVVVDFRLIAIAIVTKISN